MKKIYIIVTIVVIFLSNVPPISYIFDYVIDEKHYRYSNHSGSFDVTDRSGSNLKGVEGSFKEFVKSRELKPIDTILYRTFWKNPLAFWRWHTYFNSKDKRYKLPYKK